MATATKIKKGSTKTKAKATTKKAGGDGKPGVIASIVELLTAATSAKPINKKDLVKKLHAEFPEREELALSRTVNCQLPSRLTKDKKMTIKKNDKGYWVA